MVAPSKSPYDKHTSNPLSAHTGSACAAHLRAGHRAARRACVRGTWNPQYLTWQKGVVYGKYYPRWIRGNAVFRGETGVGLCSPRPRARSSAASSAEPAPVSLPKSSPDPAGEGNGCRQGRSRAAGCRPPSSRTPHAAISVAAGRIALCPPRVGRIYTKTPFPRKREGGGPTRRRDQE